MTTIHLTPSKQVDFKGIIYDLQNNLEEILGGKSYEFLIYELDKLQDLYNKLENERDNEQNILAKQVDYLFKENLQLEQKVENLQQELEEKE